MTCNDSTGLTITTALPLRYMSLILVQSLLPTRLILRDVGIQRVLLRFLGVTQYKSRKQSLFREGLIDFDVVVRGRGGEEFVMITVDGGGCGVLGEKMLSSWLLETGYGVLLRASVTED